MSDEKIWGWKGIAARLGVSVNTAAKYAKEKGLPAKTWGDGPRPRYFALEEELAAWEEANARLLNPEGGEERLAPSSARSGEVESDSRQDSPRPGHAANEATSARFRSVPLAKKRMLWGAAILAVVLGGPAAWRLTKEKPLKTPDPRPPQLYDLQYFANEGIIATDVSTGQRLWSKPLEGTTSTNHTEARVSELGVVLAVVTEPPDFSLRDGRKLELLEPRSGHSLRTAVLAETRLCEEVFPDYSPFYRTELAAVDLDFDSSDEIVVTYSHTPNYPSCSLVYEPKLGRTRAVYASRGHHHFQGAADLDGDGRLEVIFGGISNKQSWYRGVAAVKLEPAIGRSGRMRTPVRAPDIDTRGTSEELLLWAAYTEPGNCVGLGRCLEIQAEKGLLVFQGSDSLVLNRHGFVPGGSWLVSPGRRQRARRLAYEALRAAKRLYWLEEAGQPMEALNVAKRHAAIARDPILTQIIQVSRVESLIAQGEIQSALAEAEELRRRENDKFASYMAFDIALAFQLRGHLQQAVHWYIQGFGLGASRDPNQRPRGEFLRNMVLAYIGIGDIEAALESIALYHPFVQGEWAGRLHTYVALSTGEVGEPPDFHPGMSDEEAYWVLERRYQLAGASEELVEEIEFATQRNSEAKPLLQLLLAEALGDLGEVERGRSLVAEAERTLDGFARRHIVVAADRQRAHQRLKRLQERLSQLEAP